MRRALLAAVAAFATLLAGALTASSEPVFTEFAHHPSIAAQPESGRAIKDLAIKDGQLFMGYGDYSSNTGPIDIATVDLSTGAHAVRETAATEEINTYRTFAGQLYAPWIDPTVVGGLFSSDRSGGWSHFGPDVENVHIFDVAVLPNGVQLAVGSANSTDRSTYLGATAFVSHDNGLTWQIGMTDLTSAADPNVSGYERYYWVSVIGGKAYMQARDSFSAYGQATFPLRVFDGSRWTSVNKSADCFSSEAHQVEVFEGRAYCNNGRVFTGKRSTTNGGIYASDFYQHGGVLYALSSGKVMRLDHGIWSLVVDTLNDRARSLAVTDEAYYVGDTFGYVRKALR